MARLRFNIFRLLPVKRREVEYHHLPGSRQANSSRRLLALIVSRHNARAEYSPPWFKLPSPLHLAISLVTGTLPPLMGLPHHWQMGQQTSDCA